MYTVWFTYLLCIEDELIELKNDNKIDSIKTNIKFMFV